MASLSKKADMVNLGHAPILAKLVKNIMNGEFVELADLLSVNLRAVNQEPDTFLEGKLLVSKSGCWSKTKTSSPGRRPLPSLKW